MTPQTGIRTLGEKAMLDIARAASFMQRVKMAYWQQNAPRKDADGLHHDISESVLDTVLMIAWQDARSLILKAEQQGADNMLNVMSASFDGASHQKGYEEGRAEAFEEVIGIVRENLKTVGEFSEDCFITSKVKAFAIIALRDVLAALASLTKKKYE